MPQDIATVLNHYHPASGDYFRVGTVGENRRKYVPAETTIKDARDHLDDFKLDKQGFQFVSRESAEKSFGDETRVKDVYYKECADIVKQITGATSAVAFNHLVRAQSLESALLAEKDLPDDARSTGPTSACFVHVDQSYQGAYDRIGGLFPSEVAKLSQRRWAIINLWRPIKPVTRNPLAVSDAASIDDSELKEVKLVVPRTEMSKEQEKENRAPDVDYYARKELCDAGMWIIRPPSEPGKHQWYYASDMQPNEAWLVKIFDSKTSGVARRCPHSSFSSALDHGPPRESIEVRVYVVWDD